MLKYVSYRVKFTRYASPVMFHFSDTQGLIRKIIYSKRDKQSYSHILFHRTVRGAALTTHYTRLRYKFKHPEVSVL